MVPTLNENSIFFFIANLTNKDFQESYGNSEDIHQDGQNSHQNGKNCHLNSPDSFQDSLNSDLDGQNSHESYENNNCQFSFYNFNHLKNQYGRGRAKTHALPKLLF